MPALSDKPIALARYIMVGGFLGAGKTTAILQLARLLRDRGQRIGLITNDQSTGLVDTAMLGAGGFPVEEITGGCFCCKFDSLVSASEKLSKVDRPDVFIAEPVGSCTDLKATVDYPLRRIYGDRFAIAPLSVLIDPIRAERILGLREGSSFSDKVVYIYRKQLEEADVIVINKIDLLPTDRLTLLTDRLHKEFPAAAILPLSARENRGIGDWLSIIESAASRTTDSLEIDYDTYADGEALLGWLNATIALRSSESIDGNELVMKIASRLHESLSAERAQVAHLKLTLTPESGPDLAVANLVRNEAIPELSYALHDSVTGGELIINLRAECDPQLLRDIVERELQALGREHGIGLNINHLEAFRPGRPMPTHRMSGIATGISAGRDA